LINFGGDVRALGAKPDGSPWQIGIQDPRQLDQCFATLSLIQGALATSGDYERFFELDGQRYCHILNPTTGMPVSYWRSVTVLAPLTSAAGATSTIAMLLQEKGLDYLQNSGFAFLAIDHSGETFRGDQAL
jgi:thiamine biosynthesis lipoprotein